MTARDPADVAAVFERLCVDLDTLGVTLGELDLALRRAMTCHAGALANVDVALVAAATTRLARFSTAIMQSLDRASGDGAATCIACGARTADADGDHFRYLVDTVGITGPYCPICTHDPVVRA